jgi:hypothetical protein
VIDGDGEWRRMRQHVCYGCPTCANQGETEAGCRLEHDVSPSTTDLGKPVPPPFKVRFPILRKPAIVVDLDFVQNCRPSERENVQKGIIIENVDKWPTASRPCCTTRLIRHREQRATSGVGMGDVVEDTG